MQSEKWMTIMNTMYGIDIINASGEYDNGNNNDDIMQLKRIMSKVNRFSYDSRPFNGHPANGLSQFYRTNDMSQ